VEGEDPGEVVRGVDRIQVGIKPGLLHLQFDGGEFLHAILFGAEYNIFSVRIDIYEIFDASY